MRYVHSMFQKIIEHIYRNKVDCGKIFMFHEIVDSNSDNNIFKLEKEEFFKFIEELNKKGTIKTLTELSTNIENRNRQHYYLTFDDVYENAYKNAMKWLMQQKIYFTVFITLDYINKPGYITYEQLNDLANNKFCTIGSHSVTHPLFRNLSLEKLENEIGYSKEALEKLINRKVDYLAYPYGSKYACSKNIINIVENKGYKKAFSTFSMGLNYDYVNKNKYFIPRINVSKKVVDMMEIK